MRVRSIVEYVGTRWSGWQWQAGPPTVQGEIERALAIVLRGPCRVAAAGRTDAGVHSTGQVIAFDVPEGTPLRRLRRSVNALTDPSIALVTVEPAYEGFDPRRHALSRKYEYLVVNVRPPSPFLLDRSWHFPRPLDVEVLNRLAAMLPGERDFAAFRAADCTSNSTRRCITEARWEREGDFLRFHVRANAFLKQMVRTLVGSMVDVAIGRLPEETFAALLAGQAGDRALAGRTAPAAGLTLVHVEYPDAVEGACSEAGQGLAADADADDSE